MINILTLTWEHRDRFPMWVVYRPTTTDYPGLWVIRLHLCFPKEQATEHHAVAPTIEQIHALIPNTLFRMARYEQDAPVIEEIWF